MIAKTSITKLIQSISILYIVTYLIIDHSSRVYESGNHIQGQSQIFGTELVGITARLICFLIHQ